MSRPFHAIINGRGAGREERLKFSAHSETTSTTPATLNPHQTMPVTLTAPWRWQSANADEQKMLKNLQDNILKGHGREHTWNIFFQFGPNAADPKRVLGNSLATPV